MGADSDTDFRPRLVVLTVFAAAEVAADHRATSGGPEPLTDALRRAFDILRVGLDKLDIAPPQKPAVSAKRRRRSSSSR